MATDSPPLAERRVSLWKRALLGVLLLALVSFVGLWIVSAWTATTGRNDLAAILAEIDRDDPRWRWEQLDEDRPLMPNLDNSILRCREVVQALGRIGGKDLLTPDGDELLGKGPRNLRLDTERLALLRAAVERRSQAIELARTIKDMPRGWANVRLTPDVVSTLLPDAQNPREVTTLLELDSEVALHDGRADAVPDRIRASLHAGAGLRGEGLFLISTLVRISVRLRSARLAGRSLAMGQLSDDDCRKLGNHFAAERADNVFLDGLRGERAGMHVLLDNLRSGRVSLGDFLVTMNALVGGTGPLPELVTRGGAILYGPRLHQDHSTMLRWLHRACKIAALPPYQQASEWVLYEAELKAFVADSRGSLRNLVTAMVIPAVAKVSEAARRDNALLGCVEAALAAERFRLANKRWPASLDELCPAFLKAVPTDPYSGKPILLAALDDGLAVYSVGLDGKDDGGRMLTQDGKAGSDLGVRLWDVDRRALEPLRMPHPDAEMLKMPRVD